MSVRKHRHTQKANLFIWEVNKEKLIAANWKLYMIGTLIRRPIQTNNNETIYNRI